MGTNKWNYMGRLNVPRDCGACVVGKGEAGQTRIFCIGGYTGPKSAGLCVIEHIDLNDCTGWVVNKAALPMGLHDLAAAMMYDNKILICGGNSRLGATARCFEFDSRLDELTYAPPMNTPRMEHAAVRYGNRIVVIGGNANDETGLTTVETCEQLDLDTKLWTAFPSVKHSGRTFAAVENDRIYTATYPCGKYAMFDGTAWISVRSPTSKAAVYPFIYDGRFAVIANNTLPAEMYDEDEKKWIKVPDLNGPTNSGPMPTFVPF